MKHLLLSIILLTTSMFSFAEGDSQHGHNIMITDAYIKASIPGTTNTAAYMVLANHGKQAVTLNGAKSDLAERVEVHEHVMTNGLMKMQRAKPIEIAPGASVTMQPGGYHIMFMGTKQAIQVGETYSFTLVFDSGEEISVEAVAKKVMKGAHKKPMKHKQH